MKDYRKIFKNMTQEEILEWKKKLTPKEYEEYREACIKAALNTEEGQNIIKEAIETEEWVEKKLAEIRKIRKGELK